MWVAKQPNVIRSCRYQNVKAEAEGFEPSDRFPGQLLSRKLHSTTLPRLQEQAKNNFYFPPLQVYFWSVTIQVMELANNKEIVWKSPEFEHNQKHPFWFLTVALAALILFIIALWQASYFFAIFIILATGLIFFHGQQEPRLRECRVSERGIRVGGRQFVYADFESFSVFDRPGRIDELILRRKIVFNPFIHIPIDARFVPSVREMLQKRLPETPHEESLLDAFVDWFGF